MHLGLMSDTHNSLDAALKAFTFFKESSVDLVIHGGDWTTPDSFRVLEEQAQQLRIPMKGVLGNNDQELKTIFEDVKDFAQWVEFPKEDVLLLESEAQKIAVYHGQDHIILEALINANVYDVVIKGHSHRIEHQQIGNTLVINPGSTAFSLPRRPHFKPTIALYDTSLELVSFFEFNADTQTFQPLKPQKKGL